MPGNALEGERIFHGIAVSPGVCRGKILLLTDNRIDSIPRRTISEQEIPEQMARLEQAVTETRRQLLAVQDKVNAGMGAKDASIFDAHLLVLEDATLLAEVGKFVETEKVNIEYAFAQVAEKYAKTIEAIDDEYLRERASDMRDVTERLLQNLLGTFQELDLKHLKEPYIIVAYDLPPSRTAMLDKKSVLGFATDVGGRTSHTAIMARSLRIPAVVGLGKVTSELKDGQYALLDGYHGQLVINPTDQTLFEYGQLVQRQVSLDEKLRDTIDKPAITLDGVRLTLSANIEQAADTAAVQESGAEGVGLFRTEYLFLNSTTLPTEEQQYQAYRVAAAALKPAPLIIRTLDLGGDKFMSHLNVPKEMNPFLGWRAIRFCLEEKEIFRAQLRAILRASAEGNIKLMYPMISCLEELLQANALLDTYREELRQEGTPFDEKMQVGAMIEIPSAVLTADALAKRVQFFSIGTNDLIQYTLAVDRLNEKIAHLYEPTNPSILRLIKMTTDAAHAAGIWVGVCGEMAGDPLMIPLLLGLGVDELSVAPQAVPQIKYLIRRVKMSEAKEIAQAALQSESSTEILDRLQKLVRSVAPSLFEQEDGAAMGATPGIKILILGAGYATRLYPMTLTRPKSLLDVAGKPMIEHVLDNIAPIPGIDRVYVVTNAKFADQFQMWADHYRAAKSKLNFTVINDGSTDDSNKLGAIGDLNLVLTREKIDDDVIVVAGDNLFSQSLEEFGQFCRSRNAPVLAVYDVGNLDEIKKYNAITMDGEGRITFFEEKPQRPQSTVTGIALYFYPRSSLPLIQQYMAEGHNPDQPGRLVQWMYQRTPFYTWRVPGTWFDIGSRETLEEANCIFGELKTNAAKR